MEISPLICSANQWTGFYMITASVMKGLRLEQPPKKTLFKVGNKHTKTVCYLYFLFNFTLRKYLKRWEIFVLF